MRRIVVANEPRVYREAVAGALRIERPQVIVDLIDPAELEAALLAGPVNLVIASSLSPELAAAGCFWLLLYPEQADRGAIGKGLQVGADFEPAGLTDILRLIDLSLSD